MKKFALAAVLCAAVSTPAFAQYTDEVEDSTAQDGLRIEARATYETPTISSVVEEDDVYKLGSAFAFGGEIGYDVAVGDTVVVGPYGQYEVSNVESSEDGFTFRTTDYFEAGLHVGVSTGANSQFFGKVGYANLGFESRGLNLDTNERGSGVAFALGYEISFGENLYGRLEGGYADVGEVYFLNWQRRHLGVALGARF